MSGSIAFKVASIALKDTAVSTSLALLSLAVATGLSNLTNKVSSSSFFTSVPTSPTDPISQGTNSSANHYQNTSTILYK